MSYKTIELAIGDGIARLVLNRPQKLNSLSNELMQEMQAAFAEVKARDDIRVLVLTGNGRAFCTGADLADPDMMKPGLTPGQNLNRRLEELFNPVVRNLLALDIPVISEVNGIVAGGGVGLALAADVVVAARSATFKLTFVPRLGVIPDMGSTYALPRLMGRARAYGLSAFGEPLPAETAAQWGMIWKCVDDDQLRAEVNRMAAAIASGPPRAFKKLRAALVASEDNTLDQQLDLERDTQGELGDTKDCIEAVMAFLQKREPKFTGK